jgi:ribA/ribD-fused uncharacterized protein
MVRKIEIISIKLYHLYNNHHMEYILFWKPTQPFGEFSQWYPSVFKDNNEVIYENAEQYMMSQKALLFNDKNMYKQIMKTNNCNLIKKYGRRVKNFDNDIWLKNCYQIISIGNYFKFSQNNELKKKLLLTGDKILAEASPFDKLYGIGMLATDARKVSIDEWEGKNLLGKALMDVRKKLI